MRKLFLSKYWIFILRVIIGGLFIYASLDKILHPLDFAKAVDNYRMLPPVMVNILAILIPWVEIICGIALIIGFFSDGAVLSITILLLIFIIAMVQATIRGIDTGCGCFKVTGETSKVGWARIGEDILILLATINIIFFKYRKIGRADVKSGVS